MISAFKVCIYIYTYKYYLNYLPPWWQTHLWDATLNHVEASEWCSWNLHGPCEKGKIFPRKWGKSSHKDDTSFCMSTMHMYMCECSLGHVYLAKFVCQLVGMRKTLQTCVLTENQIRKNISTVQWLHLHVSHDSIASIHITCIWHSYIGKRYLSESVVKPVLAFQDLHEILPSKYMFLNLLPSTSIFQQNLFNHPTTKTPQPQ